MPQMYRLVQISRHHRHNQPLECNITPKKKSSVQAETASTQMSPFPTFMFFTSWFDLQDHSPP